MKEIPLKEALNKAYLKLSCERAKMESFQNALRSLLEKVNEKPAESEEYFKNLTNIFLKETFYKDCFLNTSGRIDLVIHNSKESISPISVLIETKSPANKNEMLDKDRPDCKAVREAVLYFLRERITNKNYELKHIIITNVYEWFIFDAAQFEKHFAYDKELVKNFIEFENKNLSFTNTDSFYQNIAGAKIRQIQAELEYTYFDMRLAANLPLENLVPLYKILSPEHLLKLPFENDSNTLNQNFYNELLYIMGLTEVKDGGRKIIVRRKEKERQAASLLENVIFQLSNYNIKEEAQLFETALELVIIWINRILFLKLLEAQQLSYQNNDSEYAFLNMETIKNFRDLNALFFNVLAVEEERRADKLKDKYKHIPYLNSSLFDMTIIETNYISISNLEDDEIEIYAATVLKDRQGRTQSGKLNILKYIFDFLSAYDFSSEGGGAIQEEAKTLINASVLGLIFEKINGYKDGSYFTPGFITTYICRQTIREAALQKFNTAKNWNVQSMTELYNKIEDADEANRIINDIKICDMAVGSGHFLVSALNEIIALKSELGILRDKAGKKLRDYKIEVANDELVITDDDGGFFNYNYKIPEKQRVQETIFNEKRMIIENCLFGVDINPNSVKICRLRLWIELLKNAYYTEESKFTKLETFPNLDFKILRGNSLLSINRSDLFEDAELTHLDGLTKVFFRTTDIQQKRKLRAEINKILDAYSSDGRFDFKVWFSDVFRGNNGFDAVIGNPPYIDAKKLKHISEILKENYTVYSGTADLSVYFIEKGLNLCKDTGLLSFITTNKFFTTDYGRKLRDFLIQKKILTIINFEESRVFESALVSSCILILKKENPAPDNIIDFGQTKNLSTEDLKKNMNNIQLAEYKQSLLNDKEWNFADKTRRSLKAKIESGSIALSDLQGVAIYRGVTTGYNPAFIIDRKKRSELIKADAKNKKIIKPLLQGRNIRKWMYNKSGKYLIFTRQKTDIAKYPHIENHLAQFQEQLNMRSQGNYKWYEIQANTAYFREFSKSEKIIWGLTADKWAFAYDNKKHFLPSNGYILTSKNISVKYLLALLNSALMKYYFGFIGVMTAGGAYTLKYATIAKLPFKVTKNQTKIAAIVDKILAAKAANADADTSAFEDEIDALVYKLYGLTDDEIKVVESSN